MDVKILRFLELSSEFCKEPEGYEGFSNVLIGAIGVSGAAYSGIAYSGSISTLNNTITAPHLKLEQFKSQKQAEIEKAERWEEFLELKNDLKQYLEAKIKLTK